jgi:hypothetical protein
MAPTSGDYGLADALRAGGLLTDDDVPLALLHWTAARGITFVDMWSIRRGLMSRGADRRWKWLSGECARMQAESTYLQFQDQIDDIAASGDDCVGHRRGGSLRFPPAAGLLPLALGTRPGFRRAALLRAGGALERHRGDRWRLLRSLVRESFTTIRSCWPSSPRIQLYYVLENWTRSRRAMP